MQALLDDYTNPLTRDAAVPSIQQWMNVEDRDGAAITPEEAEAELAWMERTERTLADSIMAPDGKYRQWWALKYSEAAAMPAAANRLRRLQELRGQTRVLMMENVLLAAGMALARHDQARFLAIVDPDCGRPFTCAPAGNGFQLCSTLMLGGAPVGLSFSTTGNTKP
jgi:hypothetical protein